MIPKHYKPEKVDKVWKVDYENIANSAHSWSVSNGIEPSSKDKIKTCLILVDIQNTFCIPEFELFVRGNTGTGAVDDNKRLCEFIYSNINDITHIAITMDTHQAMQVFHSIFFVNDEGEHPPPFTLISYKSVKDGKWKFNNKIHHNLNISTDYIQKHLLHYTEELEAKGKYELTIWPYHAMLGGVGHALVSSVEEAIFFHTIARYSQPEFHIKGDNPLTEHYSVLDPEVLTGPDSKPLSKRDESLFTKTKSSESIIQKLIDYDRIVIAGQAKSHCVAWTIEDILRKLSIMDKSLARKIYILEDCTSPVVVPDTLDYSEEADRAFERFEHAGMHLVRSTDPIESWS